tara:strand:- start:55418 stop:55864 length:447 start_codon:yes stop_codon:yes gene_type:complete
MEIKVVKEYDTAKLPTYATDGSGCFDLYSMEWGRVYHKEPCLFSTGLSFEIPDDHVMLVFSRSGHGFNYDIRLSNCVGVIDSDYRGTVKVKLTQDDNCLTNPGEGIEVKVGDRIAQAMVIPITQVVFKEVDELSTTERGEGGFGSTGV